MPKIASNGSATAYGQEGIVKDAAGQLWELDPSRNLDGTAVDGFESDERDLSGAEERDAVRPDDEPRPQPVDDPAESKDDESDDDQDDSDAEKQDEKDVPITGTFAVDKEESSSPGASSRTSGASRARSSSKK